VSEPPAGVDRSVGSLSLIDELVRQGAQRMLTEAVQAEVDAYIAALAEERDEHGHRLVGRNGYPPAKGGDDHGRPGAGADAAGQRQAHPSRDGRAQAVQLGEPIATRHSA
jgi:hypothetical protein